MVTNIFASQPLGAPRPASNPKAEIDGIATRYKVPANVLMALDEAVGGDPTQKAQRAETFAREISEAVAKGQPIDSYLALRGGSPEAGAAMMNRAYDIADELYPADPTEASAAPAGRPKEANALRDVPAAIGASVARAAGSLVEGVGEAASGAADLATGIVANPLIEAFTGKKDAVAPASNPATGIAEAVGGDTGVGGFLDGFVSSDVKQDMADLIDPKADIFDPSTYKLGPRPTVRGAVFSSIDVFGSMAPIVIAGAFSGPVGAAVAGGAMSGGGAAQDADQAIEQMATTMNPDGRSQLETESSVYQRHRAEGMSPDEAKDATKNAARRQAAALAAIPGALGGAATSRIFQGAGAAVSRLPWAGRVGAAAGMSAAEEGTQEVAEGVASRTGLNSGAGIDRPVTEGTMNEAMLGAIGGGPMGALGGALSRGEQPAPPAPAPDAVPESPPLLALPAPESGGTIFGGGPTSDPTSFERQAGDYRPGDPAAQPAQFRADNSGAPQSPGDGSAGGEAAAPLSSPPQAGAGAAAAIPPAGPIEALAASLPDMSPQPEVAPPPALFPDQKLGGALRLQDPSGQMIDAVFMGESDTGVKVRIAGEVIEIPPAEFDQAVIAGRATDAAAQAVAKGGKGTTPKAPETPAPVEVSAPPALLPSPAPAPAVSAPPTAALSPEEKIKRKVAVAQLVSVAGHGETSWDGELDGRIVTIRKGIVRVRAGEKASDADFTIDAKGMAQDEIETAVTGAIRTLDQPGPAEQSQPATPVAEKEPAPQPAAKAANPRPAPAPAVENIRANAAVLRGVPKDAPPAVPGVSMKWDAKEGGFIFPRKDADAVRAAVSPAPAAAPEPAPQDVASQPAPAPQKRPLISYVRKSIGMVDPKGPLGLELAQRGINARTAPGLFSKDGLKDMDNIVADEHPDVAALIGKADDGTYLDQTRLIEAMAEELGGTAQPLGEQAAVQEMARSYEEALSAARRGGDNVLPLENTGPLVDITGESEVERYTAVVEEVGRTIGDLNLSGVLTEGERSAIIQEVYSRGGEVEIAIENAIVRSYANAEQEAGVSGEPAGSVSGLPFYGDERDGKSAVAAEAEGGSRPAGEGVGSAAERQAQGQVAPATEPGADGKPQLIIPGAEASEGQRKQAMTDRQRLEMDARQKQSKMRRLDGNTGAAGPLFNDQDDMFSAVAKAVPSAAEVKAAAAVTAVDPTPAQAEAENYKTGKLSWRGLTLSIENDKGSTRSKVGPDGKVAWSVVMPAIYGRILKTVGADGDHVDFYMGPNPKAEAVFVIDQVDAESRSFDEHKVLLGFASQAAAVKAYDAAFSDGRGPDRRGGITEMTAPEFVSAISDAARWKKPIGNLDASEPAPEAASEEPAAAPPAPAQPKPARAKLTPKQEREAKAAALADYFTPGNVVSAYGGGADVVLSYGRDDGGNPAIRVQEAMKDGDTWVVNPKAGVRVHSTMPEARDLKRGPLQRAPAAVAVAEDAAAPEASPAAKIEDFGQKLEGARKDLWSSYADKMAEAEDSNIAAEPLSKSWPAPDYEKLIEAKVDPWTVAFIRAARDAVPRKPAKAWKLKGWVEQVQLLRKFSNDMMNSKVDRAEVERRITASPQLQRSIGGSIDLYLAVGHERSLQGIRLSAGSYSVRAGVAYSPAKTFWDVEMAAKSTAFSNMPKVIASAETREGAIEAFKKAVGGLENKTRTDRQTKFIIYSTDRRQSWTVGVKLGKNHIDLRNLPTVAEARKVIADESDALQAKLDRMRDIPSERRESNSPRVGADHRAGADVTPEQFAETFGFRGVQFGNWVEGAKRQADLNQAYDALLDLAGIIDIPAKAISLNGDLGLAFGARGSGGKNAFAAHYEPGKMVINLTKKSGAGSLAHEWFHALDNYFARKRGQKGTYITDNSAALKEGEALRPEVLDAFQTLKRAIDSTSLKARSSNIDKLRSNPYWATGIEMHARSFESYVIGKLQDQGASNDYLANVVNGTSWAMLAEISGLGESYPYLTETELPLVRDRFDHLFRTMERTETVSGVMLERRADPGSAATKGPLAITPAIKARLSDTAKEMNEKYGAHRVAYQPGHFERLGFTNAEVADMARSWSEWMEEMSPKGMAAVSEAIDAQISAVIKSQLAALAEKGAATDLSKERLKRAMSQAHGNLYSAVRANLDADATALELMAGALSDEAFFEGMGGILMESGKRFPDVIFLNADAVKNGRESLDLMFDTVGEWAFYENAVRKAAERYVPRTMIEAANSGANPGILARRPTPSAGPAPDSVITDADLLKVEAEAAQELRKVGIGRRVVASAIRGSRTGSIGTYQAGKIGLNLSAPDAAAGGWRGTLDHEIIHALRDSAATDQPFGLFTEAEWKGLIREARKDTELMAWADRTYPDLGTAARSEEMVAELYREWAAGRREVGTATAFEKIKALFTALANALRGQGFQSAALTMERIAGGEVGGRNPIAPRQADTVNIKEGPFGMMAPGFEGNWRGAALELERLKSGEAPGALSHPDIGPISLSWGKAGNRRSDGFGLSKLMAWHPEVLDDLQGRLAEMKVTSRTENRIQLESATGRAGVRLDWDGQPGVWLIGAYEKGAPRLSEKSTGTLSDLWGGMTPPPRRGNSEDSTSDAQRKPSDELPKEMRAALMRSKAKAKGFIGSAHWRSPGEFMSGVLTDAMTGAGPLNTLALVPGRMLFAELGKNLLSARAYLKGKEDMDALRNEWHGRADAVAQDWLKLRNKDPRANDALMDLMHRSTMTGVDPSAPMVIGQELGYRAMKALYDALPIEFQGLYKKLIAEYSKMGDDFEAAVLDNMQTATEIAIKRAERAHRKELKGIADEGMTGKEKSDAIDEADRILSAVKKRGGWGAKARIAKLRETFESNRLKGPYFPLARFGKYFVTIRDSSGKVISFSRFEKESDQKNEIRAAEQANPGRVEHGVMGEDGSSLRSQVDPTFVADIEGMLAAAGAGNEVMDAIWQRWLETLPDQSIRTSKIHRKNRLGFGQDAFRAFGKHMFHGAHQLARLKYGLTLEESLNDAREEAAKAKNTNRMGAIVNEMQKRHAFTMNPTGNAAVASLSSLAFVWYLGATPGAALANISQTTVVGIPVMAARFKKAGVTGSTRALARASKDFAKGRGAKWNDLWTIDNAPGLAADEKAAMTEAYRRGTIDKTQAHDLASVAESGIEYHATREKWMRRIGWMFHHAERFNREVTFLANYRLAKAEVGSSAAAIDLAADMTWKIHFSYQNTDRPRFMQNDIGKVLTTFRQFTVNMMYRMFRDAHQSLQGETKEDRAEARAQLIGVTLSLMAHAGIKGVWGYGILMTLLGMFFPGGGDDAEDWLQDALLMEGDSPGVAAWNYGMGAALSGVPGKVLEIDLTERIGMPNLWFRGPGRDLEGQDLVFHYMSEILGPVLGIAVGAARGAGYVAEGDVWRGTEAALPKAVRDLMKTARYANEGVTTRNGDDIMENVNPYQLLVQSMGFTPAAIGERYDINSGLMNKEKRITSERKAIHKAAGDAARETGSIPPAIVDQIRAFNAEYPEYPITSDSIKGSLQGRIRASQRNEFGVALNPKLNARLRGETPPSIFN
ncbi:PLxRFG domain-containing protein [Cereibacter changlensis]|uniref:PLxRFG domain-containing protein n=1 Tax=Cereibacter changlensis TaxID=402884 RepID=UPI004033E30B